MPLSLAISTSIVDSIPQGASAGGGVTIGGKSPLVWIDATSTDYLYQDNGTSTPVTAVNDPVGRITDRSGNDRYGFQASASLKGLWTGTGVALDGTDDRYEFVLASGDRTDDMAVFLVSVVDIGTSRFAAFIGGEDGGSNANGGGFFGIAINGNTSTNLGGTATAQRVDGSAVANRDETFDAMATGAVSLWEAEGAEVATALSVRTRPGIFNLGGDTSFVPTAELRAFLVFDMTSWGAGDFATVRSAIATEYGVTL